MPDFGRWTSNGGDPSLNDINRVDRFFDALSSKQTAYSTDHAEAELAFLLADWRDDVRDAPVTAPVTPRDAAAALRGGLDTRKRSRTSLALVGSAAAAVLCLGGFGVAVFGSGPGDAFYGMRTTLFGQEQQVRNEQVTLASQQLQQVQELIDQGQWEQAQDKLATLSTTVQSVEAAPEQRQDLIQQWNALTYKVVEQDPAATLPPAGEPMPVLPDSPLTLLPVPVIETSTSSSSTSTTTTSTSTSSETPGPEIVLTSPTSPTSPSETSDPTSPPTSPTTTTTTSAPTSTTTTTTTTTSPPSEVTSVPPVSQTAAAPPSTATQAPVPASEPPPRQPQLVPSSSVAPPPAPPAAPAPPAGGSSGSGPAVAPSQSAPSQSEPTTVTQNAPKKPSEDEQPVVTTTVAPPH
jgi:hypothetical protein